MKLMDPHLHLEGLNNASLQEMAMCGVQAVIGMVALPEEVPDPQRRFPATAIFDYCDRALGFQSWTLREHFLINTYLCTAVSMVGVPDDYEHALERLGPYIEGHEKIVGIGEVGLEPSSPTCPELEVQEKILRAQLELARQQEIAICFHTPLTEKPRWLEKYLQIIDSVGLQHEQVIIDHADATVTDLITRAGCWAAITVQPHRHVRAGEAAAIIARGDRSRILVDSDTATLNESDPLAVPRTAFEMKKRGWTESEIEAVLWENPHKAYGLP